MTNLTKAQQDLYDAAETKAGGIFVQGATMKAARSLRTKGLGFVRPLTDTRGWFVRIEFATDYDLAIIKRQNEQLAKTA